MSNDRSDVSQAFFSSKRERRLWTWTAILVLGIYATLGIASTLARWLYNQDWAAVLFLTCMFLILVTVLTQGLRVRPKGVEIGVGLGIAVVYLLVLMRVAIPERSHLIEYGVVAVFVYEALHERRSQGRRVPFPAVLAIAITTIIGSIDEFIQLWLPSRVFDWTDILFNFLASFMAVFSMSVLGWARNWATRIRSKK